MAPMKVNPQQLMHPAIQRKKTTKPITEANTIPITAPVGRSSRLDFWLDSGNNETWFHKLT